MKRTGAGSLLLAAVLGAVAGFLIDSAFSAAGRPTFTPAVSLPILLLLLGALVVVLAIPVYRASRGRTAAAIDPFRALRIAMLAKASSIVGAALGGLGVGLLAFLLTRPVVPSLGSMGTVIATAVCGGLLIAAGLVAEQLCTIRKDDDDDQPGNPSGVDATDR
ncbi:MULTISPECIES: DUF3180 family protein [Microbacterium]|uniref:DUF3180 family protein n=1 Tax=Microbacterium wangchenii TaxID=2541726 RepID=A0ABX5SRE6_9MICO|nr:MULTISPECIES: DUF3180 family protein [Microbacterium]MCK6066472.1 DUF3180 domain-containing protein [Microbacterium sp. EYE_512]QBR87429.1 DUF3180 family protein [Microbacterium wangchenii]TFV84460.1 DUF3180 family protein [Microbacterium sp. dk485]TXK14751.1 DUF3180 family protein [Microbacterium wangchenii]